MAKAFDLRKNLKLHDKQLLGRLFERCGAPIALPWERLGPGEIRPIVDQWETLGDSKRPVQIALQEISELADSRGLRLLIDELRDQHPQRLDELSNYKSLADKALWVYLECPKAFEQAAIFHRAESLRGGQFANRWNSMPKRSLEICDDKLAKLREAVRKFYWNRELRGEVCEVHHYRRVGDTDFFFAYLPDWPDKLLAFDTEGQLAPREESLAFNNVFVFDPKDGSVELIAKGGLKVQQQLRKAFCKAILDIDVNEDEPIRQAYQLDHLIDPAFSFEIDPQDRIAAVRTQRLRIVPKTPVEGVAHVEIKFHAAASRMQVLSAVDRCLHAYGLSRSGVRIQQVSLQLEFLPLASKAAKQMSFKVHLPNTCDLKSFEDEERVVGERCLRRWGVML
jgi:hypothetical protein